MKRTLMRGLGGGAALALLSTLGLTAQSAWAAQDPTVAGVGGDALPATGGQAATGILIAAGVLILLGAIIIAVRLARGKKSRAGAGLEHGEGEGGGEDLGASGGAGADLGSNGGAEPDAGTDSGADAGAPGQPDEPGPEGPGR